MMPTEVRQARAALIARRRALADEVRRVERAIEALDALVGLNVPAHQRQRGSGIKDAVGAILREAGGPLHADDILAAVEQRGVEIRAGDKKGTVVTALIRLRDAGEVRALGRNVFEWRGTERDVDDTAEEDDDGEEEGTN